MGHRLELRRHHAQRAAGELHLQRDRRPREHAGELRVVLRRAALRELDEQRAGERRHGDRGLHAARRNATPSNVATVTRNPGGHDLPPERGRVVQGGLLRSVDRELFRLSGGLEHADDLRDADGARPTAPTAIARPGSITTVGSYPGSASPYGTFDQGGNICGVERDHPRGPAAELRIGLRGDRALRFRLGSLPRRAPARTLNGHRLPPRDDPRARAPACS